MCIVLLEKHKSLCKGITWNLFAIYGYDTLRARIRIRENK